MKPKTPTSLLLAFLAVLLVASACSGSDTAAPSGETATTEATSTDDAASAPDATALATDAIDAAAEGYERTIGAWDGFDPREHPTVIPLRSGGAVTEALLINHSNPDALGTASAIETDGTPFETLHRVALNDEYRQRLEQTAHFEFNAMIGDVDSFIMVADRDDSFLDPARDDWAPTLIHEMFHRYQEEAFTWGPGGQDVDGYAYTQENLSLALLEERALRAAVMADTDESRLEAARHFVGLRLARLAADDRVQLDNSQEHVEGTARYIEHLMSGDDERYSYHDGNFDRDLLDGFTLGQTKDEYGFGRFYTSGAAILRILDLLGAADVIDRIEAGEAPAEILADHLGIADAEAAALVDAAWDAYGDDDLAADAAAAGEGAADEPSFFGEDESDDGEREGEAIELTDEQIACLDAADIGDDGIVPDAVWEECVGA